MRRPSRPTAVAIAFAVLLAPMAMIVTNAYAAEPYLGQIETFAFNYPPRGWATCDGQLLSIASYSALFALMGPTFGGNGTTTFALPDLRGRVAVHVGTGVGLNPVSWGQRGGSQTATLNVNNLPAHTHVATLRGDAGNGTQTSPAGGTLANDPREDQYSTAAPGVDMKANSVVVESAGGGQAFSVRDPYLGIYHCIALQGLWPARN